jgi:hypothetical protein
MLADVKPVTVIAAAAMAASDVQSVRKSQCKIASSSSKMPYDMRI